MCRLDQGTFLQSYTGCWPFLTAGAKLGFRAQQALYPFPRHVNAHTGPLDDSPMNLHQLEAAAGIRAAPPFKKGAKGGAE